jgi:hypothetical protein
VTDIDITPVRQMLQADGVDAELLGTDDSTGTARLRLVIDDVDCADCVMPRPFLEALALKILKPTNPTLQTIQIDDPRER